MYSSWYILLCTYVFCLFYLQLRFWGLSMENKWSTLWFANIDNSDSDCLWQALVTRSSVFSLLSTLAHVSCMYVIHVTIPSLWLLEHSVLHSQASVTIADNDLFRRHLPQLEILLTCRRNISNTTLTDLATPHVTPAAPQGKKHKAGLWRPKLLNRRFV